MSTTSDLWDQEIKAALRIAFRAGQEAMREKAAYACDKIAEVRGSKYAAVCADLIREIEIKDR